MSRPEDLELIDRHLAGVLEPADEARLEALIRSSPEWAQRYREAEDLARVMRQGLGDGAPAPASVKAAIRRRTPESPARRPLPRRTPQRRRWLVVAAAAVLVVGLGALLWPRTELMPMGFLDEPLALKDAARQSQVAIVADTVLQDGRVRIRPRRVLYGDVGDRAIAVPADLASGHRIALFGRYDGTGMIRPVEGMRGIVHLSGVQRWEGVDRPARASRALVEKARSLRSLEETLADLEAFLASDDTTHGTRAGLVFSADVAARHLGAYDFEAIVKPLVKLVMDGDKHPDVRNAAAEGLERSDRTRACEVLLQSMSRNAMAMLQAESEDGQVVLGCLALLRRSGSRVLAPTLEQLAGRFRSPALREAAQAAHDAVTGVRSRDGALPKVARPVRLQVGGREGVLMSGAQGRQDGLLVVFRGEARIVAFRPIVNPTLARGFGVLILPGGARDLEAWLDASVATGLVRTQPLCWLVHGSAREDAQAAQVQRTPDRIAQMPAGQTPAAFHTPDAQGERPLDRLLAR